MRLLRRRPPSGRWFTPCSSWLLFSCLAVVIAFLSGCGKKTVRKSDIRAVTSEIVDAAQRITGRQSEVTIRPQIKQASISKGGLVADDIFISLHDPGQATALTDAFLAIARRHKLSAQQTYASGVTRLDFTSNGTRTHTVHLITELPARRTRPALHAKTAELAIIVDDLGHDRSAADSLLALPYPITVSVLPHLPLSADVAEEAYRRGDQVMLHLPMESQSEGEGPEGAVPEATELRVGMNANQVAAAVDGMLETVPHAAGVNNHQGSRATADPALMGTLMPLLRGRNLFFIDSRTTSATVAYDTAENARVHAASRKVFLDDTATRDAVLAQLELAARDATRDGSAIAIGHPHPATIAALSEELPRLEARGIRLVFASDLVH